MSTVSRQENFLSVDLSPDNGVEKILETKIVAAVSGSIRYYQVQWKPTWETEYNLTKYCNHLIFDFWNQQKQFGLLTQEQTQSSNEKPPSQNTTVPPVTDNRSSQNTIVLPTTDQNSLIVSDEHSTHPDKTIMNTTSDSSTSEVSDSLNSSTGSFNSQDVQFERISSRDGPTEMMNNSLNLPQPLQFIPPKQLLNNTAQILLQIPPPQPQSTLVIEEDERELMMTSQQEQQQLSFQDNQIVALNTEKIDVNPEKNMTSVTKKRKQPVSNKNSKKNQPNLKVKKNAESFVPIQPRPPSEVPNPDQPSPNTNHPSSRSMKTRFGKQRQKKKAEEGDDDLDGSQDDYESLEEDDEFIPSPTSFTSSGASKRKVRKPRKSVPPPTATKASIKPIRTRKNLNLTKQKTENTTKEPKELPEKPKRVAGEPITCERCGQDYTKLKCPNCSLATCKSCGIKYKNSFYKEKCRACTNKCILCNQSFRKPSDVVKHIEAIHERVKKYNCEICSKGFAAKQYLNAHMESHKIEANHICQICNKGFKTGRRLNRHKKTHTGAKPFTCPMCSRCFHQKIALKTHMLTHSEGPKRFQCLLCKKGFNHKVSLKSHMLKHHDKNEQQAAVMIGLWKKYQKDEVSIQNATSQDDVLVKALNAVAMTPVDSTQTVAPQQQQRLGETGDFPFSWV